MPLRFILNNILKMGKIIDGKEIAQIIYGKIRKEMEARPNLKPGLAVIQIGEREDSTLYIKLKEKQARRLGIETHLYKFSEQQNEREILETIDFLNKDKNIDAILVQLPLPKNFDTEKIIKSIAPEKDVDRFHPKNIEKFFSTCNHSDVMPPVVGAVLEIFSHIDYEIKDKKAIIISNSKIFGESLAKALECKKAKVDNFIFPAKDLKKFLQADIFISAVGEKEFIKENMVKEGAVVIDIGIVKQGKKVRGDIDFEKVKKKAGYITPVPGGIGPITIAMLLKNTVALAEINNN